MRIFRLVLVCVILCSFVFGCGRDMTMDGKEYKTIGIANIIVNDSSLLEPKYPNVQYRVIWGNVFWGIVLSKTVIVPIYFFGFSMFEPVGKK